MNGVTRGVKGVKAGIGAMLVCVVLLASGCGKDEPKRSALAESLAGLCEQARADTEELGLPSEKGFVVMKPTAAIGLPDASWVSIYSRRFAIASTQRYGSSIMQPIL